MGRLVVLVLLVGCGLTLDTSPRVDGGGGLEDVGIRDAGRVDAVLTDAPTDAANDGELTDGSRDAARDAFTDAPFADAMRPDALVGRLHVDGLRFDSASGPGVPARELRAQLNPYPWYFRSMELTFSDLVVLPDGAIRLHGSTTLPGATLSIATTDGRTKVALDSGSLLVDGRYCLEVRDTVERTADAEKLDGDWSSPYASASGDTFPSGNGSEGGVFLFPFNILRGDLDGNGVVENADVMLFDGAGVDINGDGVVNTTDRDIIVEARTTRLPDTEYPGPCGP